ncbi:MAG: hypothetical protein U9N81_06295 [Bacillota bacterium]|nr:hypothetical protein [Bacillota bacterium]
MKVILENITIDGLKFVSHHISDYLPMQGTLQKDREDMINKVAYILESRDTKYLRSR